MTKKDFLDKLRGKLEILKSDEVEDIINGKVTDKRFRLQEILDSEYFIYEEK